MSNLKVIPMNQNTKMNAALQYAAIGWKILPCWWAVGAKCACGNDDCHNQGKHPIAKLVPKGQDNATDDASIIKEWWSKYPEANLAANLSGSNLVAIDLDPRNGGLQTMDDLEAKHGALYSDLMQFTGGGGEHRIFSLPANMQMPGTLGKGIDVKANGYIMLEPSNHVSGKEYAWEASSDPRDGVIASPLPDWLRDHARTPFGGSAPYVAASRLVDQKQVDDLRDALSTQSADDYHVWVNYGNALTELGQAGFTLWDEWSQKSKKYDASTAYKKWRTFKAGTYQLESIFFVAQADGWLNPATLEDKPVVEAQTVSLESVVVAEAVVADTPASVLKIPGTLGKVAEWIDASSTKSQPMFSIQAALAFGCTVMGRRIVSSNRNWSSMYFLCIGKSASGKEHGKWAIEKLLSECGLENLIGPNGYTSSPGVLCSVFDQPNHVTVIDEFGRELEKASVKQNANSQGMLKTLLEVWGRCDGVLRPQGFSTNGLSTKDRDSLKNKITKNPALTLYAMTVPDSFFESVGSAAARDGFLNRFVIVESEIGRQPTKFRAKPPVPEEIKEWVSEIITATNNLGNALPSAGIEPIPLEIPISKIAMELFADFEIECHEYMNEYDKHGLGEMFGRSCEIAMRMAMVVSMGMGRKQWGVEAPDAAWAIGYVRFHAKRTVERLMHSVSDTDFEAIKKQVYHLILQAGPKGMTERDISQGSRRFRGIDQRQQVNVLNSMKFLGEIEKVSMETPNGVGRKRTAWVAVGQDVYSEGSGYTHCGTAEAQ